MKRLSGALAAVVALVLTIVAAATAGGPTTTDGAPAGAAVDTSSAIVQLTLDPVSIAARTKPAHGKKIDLTSNTVKAYRAELRDQRNAFKQWLQTNAPKAKVTGEIDIALNAVAVKLNGESLNQIASAPMVKKAQYEGIYRALDDNDPDLALINAINAWSQGGGAANSGCVFRPVPVAVPPSGIWPRRSSVAPTRS